MRVISGIYKGREIASPNLTSTHPMGSREKIALFNMLADWLPKASVLDAFAGSGALGIEALSRGAKKAVFIEKNPKAARIIKKNLADLGLNEDVFIGDAKDYPLGEKFEIILADPPYDDFKLEEVVCLTKYLKDGGVLVLSHPGTPPEIVGLNLTKSKKYAGATISIYQK